MTVKEIAKHVGVSRATVYRVLNHHPYVNPEVREQIEELIQKYDCSPNTMGKALAMQKKSLKIYIILSDRTESYYEDICTGVYKSFERIKHAGIEIEFIEQLNFWPGVEANAIQKAIDGNASAIAICPIEGERVGAVYDLLAEKGIPYATFGADCKRDNRIFFVGHKNYQSGRTSGYMMNMYISGQGKILMVSPSTCSDAHAQRQKGFLDYLKENAPDIEIMDAIDSFNDKELIYKRTVEHLKKHPDIKGIYVISRGISRIVRALKELGLENSVRIITYDMTPDHKQYLQEGILDMVIQQDPVSQGCMVMDALYQYLIDGKRPYPDYYLTDTIITVKESL